jgi:hypothetical protein
MLRPPCTSVPHQDGFLSCSAAPAKRDSTSTLVGHATMNLYHQVHAVAQWRDQRRPRGSYSPRQALAGNVAGYSAPVSSPPAVVAIDGAAQALQFWRIQRPRGWREAI